MIEKTTPWKVGEKLYGSLAEARTNSSHMKPIPMTVTPIPGESGRYLVQSSSRQDVQHTVDLRYQEEPSSKPVPFCGCEQVMAKHAKSCKHIEAVIEYEQQKTP